jgi:hypothetical protein
MSLEDARTTARRLRHRLTMRVMRPVEHLLDKRLSPMESRLTALADALAAAPKVPAESPIHSSELHHALRTAEVAHMPRHGVSTLLSAGCAGRWYFDWINEHYGAVKRHIGIEWYSPEPPDLPPEVTWIRNSVGDMADVDDGAVDLVFSGQNVEHLSARDVVAFLGEAHRVLRLGGHLVVDSPNRLVTARCGWSHPEHTIELTPREAAKLVTLAGFDVRAVRGMWRCVSATGATLPFDTTDQLEQLVRTQSAVDAPDDAFLWWLEAERADRAADLEAVRAQLDEIYEVAWPEAVNRLHNEIGTLERDADDVPWIAVAVGERGFAVRGPPTALVPGDWTVTFRVDPAADAPSNAKICRAAVIAPEGGTLAESRATVAQLLENPEITLSFTTGPGFVMGVEFVVEAVGGPAFRARRTVTTTHVEPEAAGRHHRPGASP